MGLRDDGRDVDVAAIGRDMEAASRGADETRGHAIWREAHQEVIDLLTGEGAPNHPAIVPVVAANVAVASVVAALLALDPGERFPVMCELLGEVSTGVVGEGPKL